MIHDLMIKLLTTNSVFFQLLDNYLNSEEGKTHVIIRRLQSISNATVMITNGSGTTGSKKAKGSKGSSSSNTKIEIPKKPLEESNNLAADVKVVSD
jgi:hypothetical protein